MVPKDLTLTINLSIYAPITMTSFIKKDEIKNNWLLIDAENAIVGRLAAYISKVLRGKNIIGIQVILVALKVLLPLY